MGIASNLREEPDKRQVHICDDPFLRPLIEGHLSPIAYCILRIVRGFPECRASNSYFRDLTGKSILTIRNEVSRLVRSGYLIVTYEGKTRHLHIGSGRGHYRVVTKTVVPQATVSTKTVVPQATHRSPPGYATVVPQATRIEESDLREKKQTQNPPTPQTQELASLAPGWGVGGGGGVVGRFDVMFDEESGEEQLIPRKTPSLASLAPSLPVPSPQTTPNTTAKPATRASNGKTPSQVGKVPPRTSSTVLGASHRVSGPMLFGNAEARTKSTEIDYIRVDSLQEAMQMFTEKRNEQLLAEKKRPLTLKKIDREKDVVYFRQLRDTVDDQLITKVLDFHLEQLRSGDRYAKSSACNAHQFQKLFDELRGKMERWEEKNPVVEISERAEGIVDYLNDMWIWPKGSASQLPVVVQKSLDNFDAFYNWLWDLKAKEDPEAFVVVNYRYYEMLLNSMFIESYFKEVHEQVYGWEDWSGDLTSFIWSLDNKRVQRWGVGLTTKYAHSDAKWMDLMELAKELKSC